MISTTIKLSWEQAITLYEMAVTVDDDDPDGRDPGEEAALKALRRKLAKKAKVLHRAMLQEDDPGVLELDPAGRQERHRLLALVPLSVWEEVEWLRSHAR